MKINTIENAVGNKVKLHCETCRKILSLEDFGLEDFASGIIDLVALRGELHEQRHPKHKPEVHVYKRLPTNQEIRKG